jgi:uncharacterized protein
VETPVTGVNIMNHALFVVRLIACSLLALFPALPVLEANPAFSAGEEPILPLAALDDGGSFTYFSNEETIGLSHSTWSREDGFENRASVTMAGRKIETNLKIPVDEKGYWTTMSMDTTMGKVVIERAGEDLSVRFGERKMALKLRPGTRILEDMSPCLMSQAVAAYDGEKGGKQVFPLFFIPSAIVRGSLEYLESFERFVGGRHQEFRRFEYVVRGIYTIFVTVDGENRVCLAEYPAQHGVFLREGCEALSLRAESDTLLSKAEFDVVVEKNRGVPMRDRIELATDIYRPQGDGKFPVILVRTPYKKELASLKARFYARRGYVFAVQDVRGRFASPGVWEPFFHEADDGYDTIEWLAEQPWSSGKVGMIGGSYLGWVQWWAASRRPPHLATMIPNVSPPEPWYNFPGESGALFLSAAIWWAKVVEEELTADISGLSIQDSLEILGSDDLLHLPVIELDEVVLGRKSQFWREWLAHPDNDGYWKKLAYVDAMKEFDIPIYHQSGWYDGDGIGAKLNYAGMKAHGHRYQKLVLGPWGHTDTDSRFGLHDIDWGPKAVIDLQKSYLRWMDRWLKGIDNGIDGEPLVSLFVMGPNDWLHGDTYPLEGTRMTRFHLAGGGKAAGFGGDGRLTTDLPGAGVPPDRYTYDPGDPTPVNPEGRSDILVYTLGPVAEPLTIAGPLSAVLYASSSAQDTDWVVRLVKMDAENRPLHLGRGIMRARYRESTSRPTLLKPGEICRYEIDMWQTGVRVDKGERLVLVVCSALFPQFSRNLNTGGNNETGTEFLVAEQAVYHEKDYPSHLLLPVIEAGRL